MATQQAPERAFKLVLLGHGSEEASLRRLSESEGVADRIVFAGRRNDIPAVMKAFDVFALTSDYEGFGLVLLESMSAGKPVVATNVSAIPEVVTPGETGILVPAQDPAAFGRALVDLLDPDLRIAMGRAGRRRVAEAFSPDAMVQATLAVYQEVVAL
jgi:glycosyltransferase involved in cell wall biosynthesis